MDLQGLIDSRVEQTLAKSQFLNSLPCEVLAFSDGMATVRLTTNNVVYTVPSYVGNVTVGDFVKLYFNGISPNERNSYIGATTFMDNVGELVTIVGTDTSYGSMPYERWWFDDSTVVQRTQFAGGTSTFGQVILTLNVYSSVDNDIRYAVFVNNAIVKEYQLHVLAGSITSITLTQPFVIPNRENVLEIRAYATYSCSIPSIISYVNGYGIVDTSPSPKQPSLNITYSGDGTIPAGSTITFDVITEKNLGSVFYRYESRMQDKFSASKSGKTVTVSVSDDAPVDGEFSVMFSAGTESTEVPFRVTEPEFQPTSESDYITDASSNIMYYTGAKLRPEIPTMLNNLPVKKLYATAFNYKDVTSVKIPEGVEEIE